MRYKIEYLGIHILAFLVARCCLFGMYPFVVPFFMAAYLQEQSSFGIFIALMLGVASYMDGAAMIRYGLVLVFLLGMLKSTDRSKIFANNYQIALASGGVLWAVSMPYQYLITGKEISVIYTLLEGILCGCSVLIFQQGMTALRSGTGRMFADNKRFVGIFALLATALFGCPAGNGAFPVLFVVCGYLLLYNTYRFDGSIGIATGSITGLVLAFRMGDVSYLAVMILLASLAVIMKELGKPGVLLSYFAGYLLLGVLYDRALLEAASLTGAVAVSALFLLTPSVWLKRVPIRKEDVTALSQDILIQEASRKRIEKFGQAFVAMEKILSEQEEQAQDLPNGLSNMYLSGDGISLLNAVESQSNRLAELRHNFIRQLGQIGEVIQTFPVTLSERSLQIEVFECRVTARFSRIGVNVTKAVMVKDAEQRLKVYLSCYLDKEKVVTGKKMAQALCGIVGKEMVCMERAEDAVSRRESRFAFTEQAEYMLTTGIVRCNRSGEALCGDNFSVIRLENGKAVLMISDGMGSGETANTKSGQVVELLEQLLSAGFGRGLAIELLNSCISFLDNGRTSSTLDLTVLDLYTGMTDFVKLGASTTFIRRKGQVECIRSTSLPVGVLEQVEFDTCERKLYHGDIIVMVSDGVLDSILFENKETYLADLIANADTNNAQKMADMIMQEIVSMQRGQIRDDSTILVAGVWER